MRAIATLITLVALVNPCSHAADQTLTISLSAGAIQPLTGVNIGPAPWGTSANVDLTTGYQALGVTLIRTHDYYGPLDMATMYPSQSADPALAASYNFAESDKTYAAILNGGFTAYLRLGDSYSNLTGFPKASPRKPSNQDNWIKAAIEVIRHYNDGARWGAAKLNYIEIWNEPDNPDFWDGTQTEFNTFYAKAYKAIKAAFPALKIGGPGYTPKAFLTAGGQADTRKFLDYLKAQAIVPDFLSWHMYTNEPGDYTTAARFYRSELDSHGMTSTESHVSEWNTETENLGKAEQAELRTGARGASIMTAAWIIQQQEGVAQSLVYRGPDPELSASTYYGVFYANGVKKRVALAYSLWTDLVKRGNRLAVVMSTAASGSGVTALAAQGPSGEIGVLVANPNNKVYSYQLALSHGGTIGTATLREVNSSNEQINSSSLSAGSVTIPAYGVQLLTFVPGNYCESNLSAALALSVPYLYYSGNLYAVTFTYDSSHTDGFYLVSSTVAGAGVPNCRPAATLLPGFKLQVPALMYSAPTSRSALWAGFDYSGVLGGGFLFKASTYGAQ